MKTYLEPETHVLQVLHSGAICTVSPFDSTMLGEMEYEDANVAW